MRMDRKVEGQKREEILESILHPAIGRLAASRLDALRKQADLPMIVLDVPLLMEAGWDSWCDEIIFVETPFELRKKLAAQRGWSVDELAKREDAQLALEKKRAAATQIVVNDGDLESFRRKIDELFDKLKS